MWRPSIAALLAGLALSACGSSGTTSASSSTPAATPTSTSTSTSTPTSASTSASASTSTASAPAKAPAPCAASQLRLVYVGTEGATGHLEMTLALDNGSDRACSLRGYPGARLLNRYGRALPLTVKRGGGFFPDTQRRPRPVLLGPGGRARFGISFVTNNEYAGARVCRTAAVAVSSAPDAADHWWRLALPDAPRISPCGDQLVVSPIHS